MSFQSPLRIAACPMNPGRGGSKLISISLRGVAVLAVMVDYTVYAPCEINSEICLLACL